MATSIQETRPPAIDLPITTPVTQQTYYTLYVHNPQVSCICALFNRIIYFLFSWMECCLGKASDQSKKISMQNEITLIHNFTTAEKELLSALRAAENNQGQGTQQGTQKEEENYFNALSARQEQINSFAFSQEALAQGCQKVDLADVARLRFQQQFKGPLPASLMSILSQIEPEPSSSGLEQPQSGQETEQPSTTPSSSQSNPPLNVKTRTKTLDDKRKIVTDQLLTFPDFNSVAKADIQGYIEAFTAFHAFLADSSKDVTFFYTELTILRFELSKLKDRRLPLVLAFAKQFGLPESDPKFVDTYAAQTRIYYIEQHFSYPTLMDMNEGAYALLKNCFHAIGEIYRTAHPDATEEEIATYAKKQVTMLLSDVHKGYAAKYADLSKYPTFPLKNQAYQLAQHLHCFASDALLDAQVKGAQFIEDVLNGKTTGAPKSTDQNPQSSASQSTSSSQSSMASVSLSSSTSTVGSTSTFSLDTPPVKSVETNRSARDALVKSFGEVRTADRIPTAIFQNYVAALKTHHNHFNSDYSKLLNKLNDECYYIGSSFSTKDTPLSPNEILRLNVLVGIELGIADVGFLEKAIADMLKETVSGLTKSFKATTENSNRFKDFFKTVKLLSTWVQPEANHDEYAKEQLKKLFTAMHANAENSSSYQEFAWIFRDTENQSSSTKFLITIAHALPGFGSGASQEAQMQAENLLTSIMLTSIIESGE